MTKNFDQLFEEADSLLKELKHLPLLWLSIRKKLKTEHLSAGLLERINAHGQQEPAYQDLEVPLNSKIYISDCEREESLYGGVHIIVLKRMLDFSKSPSSVPCLAAFYDEALVELTAMLRNRIQLLEQEAVAYRKSHLPCANRTRS